MPLYLFDWFSCDALSPLAPEIRQQEIDAVRKYRAALLQQLADSAVPRPDLLREASRVSDRLMQLEGEDRG